MALIGDGILVRSSLLVFVAFSLTVEYFRQDIQVLCCLL
jgi:hypothetical protein